MLDFFSTCSYNVNCLNTEPSRVLLQSVVLLKGKIVVFRKKNSIPLIDVIVRKTILNLVGIFH